MRERSRLGSLLTAGIAISSVVAAAGFRMGQAAPPNSPPAQAAPPTMICLTLEEAKTRLLANNKLLSLAALNVSSKGYATKAMCANYFPQVIGASVYFHFNDPLGSVLSTPGRKVIGPRGVPLGAFPPTTINVPVFNQDSQFSTIAMVQPITDLLKVCQGVKIARADQQIAQAQLEKATRELLSGLEQLFWGLLAAQKLRAGTGVAIAGAEELAKTGNLEARIALLEGKQALQQVDAQIADLMVQLLFLVDLPPCTHVELVEPPLPLAPVKCADEAVSLALAASPEVKEAEQTICKAQAAVAAAKVDYLPNVAVVGGYANNTLMPAVQQDIGYVGVVATYTFVDWGKRKNTICERKDLVAMASLKLQQTQDEIRQKAIKAFGDYEQSQLALTYAQEMVPLRKQAAEHAIQPADKFKAAKEAMTAQVDYVKADLAHRIAYVKLMNLICQQ
jgi:outer membrane protein TolC